MTKPPRFPTEGNSRRTSSEARTFNPDNRCSPMRRQLRSGRAGCKLAKHLGANVTAVCSTAYLELVRSLGADAVLDYTTLPADRRYDVAFDAVGRRKRSPAG